MTGLDPRAAPADRDVLGATSDTYDRIATAYAGRAELTAPLAETGFLVRSTGIRTSHRTWWQVVAVRSG